MAILADAVRGPSFYPIDQTKKSAESITVASMQLNLSGILEVVCHTAHHTVSVYLHFNHHLLPKSNTKRI